MGGPPTQVCETLSLHLIIMIGNSTYKGATAIVISIGPKFFPPKNAQSHFSNAIAKRLVWVGGEASRSAKSILKSVAVI